MRCEIQLCSVPWQTLMDNYTYYQTLTTGYCYCRGTGRGIDAAQLVNAGQHH